jgi:tetratricopeptide (TPR) repeat protein
MSEQLSKYRKATFIIIMVFVPIILLVLFEVTLRIAKTGNDLSLFKKSELYPGYYEINKGVGKRYFAKFKETTPTNDIFLIDKPDSCYRIFVLGCSTTRGFPYQSGTMFSRILYYQLQDVFPNKRVEVVNLSFSAINSYSVADMIDEVLAHQPDIILIYTGHNEYYGALGVGSVENGGNYIWLKKIHLSLLRLKTYQLLQKSIAWLSSKLKSNEVADGTLMERIVKEKKIAYGSSLYFGGIEQFEYNIREVLEKAKKRNVPVILSELVSNLRDQKPFVSDKDNPLQNADFYFNKAQSFEEKGQFDSAKANYIKAKDFDMLRFRASEDLNTIIHKLGEEYKTPVVPMVNFFEKYSPNGLIGNNLMLEHLHPNINGYFIMSDAFFNIMKNNGFINKTWDTLRINPISYYRNNWGFTPFDSLVGDLKIKMLKAGWPFQPEAHRNNFKESYVPFSFEDSLAFDYVISENVHIEDKHVYLANYYSKKGMFRKAFNEYYSLIKCYPYVSSLYYDAAQQLILNKEYDYAYTLINSMPNRDSSYFYFYIQGLLLNKLEMYDEALFNLKKSFSLNPIDNDKIAILSELYSVYKTIGDTANANGLAKKLIKINPGFFAEKQKKTEVKTTTKQLLENAQVLASQGKFDDAEALLLTIIKKEESSLAYQILGAIYFQRKDFKAYTYYLKAYKLEPKNPEIINNLFLLSMIKKDYNSAKLYLDELRALSNDYARIQRYEQYLMKAVQKN